jgi:uncharacterized protein (DUF58 family)
MNEPFFTEDFLLRLERLVMAARRATPGQTQGERRSPRRGQSVEFSDFRPYVAGDDFRRIDWNAYARLERFFIKLFVEEEDLSVHFLIDCSRSMRWGQPDKLDYAIHAAGALGYITLCSLDRVTVTGLSEAEKTTNGYYFPAQRGKRQALSLFNFLQKLTTTPVPIQGRLDPVRQLRAYAGNSGHPGLLVLFSDLMDDGWVDGLSALAGRGFEISVVHVLSPDEVNPDLEGDLKLLDLEEDAAVEVTADYDLLSRYRQNLADWQKDLHNFCSRRNMNYVPLETSLPLEQLLFTWMRRQGMLR